MPGSAQVLLLVEGAGFRLASLVHRVELLLGLVLTWLAPGWRRPVARGARP